MYIDIHRHSINKGKAQICIRNLFHNQSNQIEPDQYYSVGLHPWHVNADSLGENLCLVRNIANHHQIIAIGEAGLDKKIDTPIELQLQAFQSQIDIAVEADKPIIIHCVRAYNEIYNLKIKAGSKKPWLIHWFNADIQMALQMIRKGFYLSFGHMLFKEDSKAFKAFSKIPMEFVFFETDDAGYEIDEIYKRASEILSIPISLVEKKIEQNFENFFGFKP